MAKLELLFGDEGFCLAEVKPLKSWEVEKINLNDKFKDNISQALTIDRRDDLIKFAQQLCVLSGVLEEGVVEINKRIQGLK